MSTLVQVLTAPFGLAFMQNAFVIAALVALPMSLLSAHLVVRGWSLMGDAIGHAVLPGIVIAYIIGLPLAIGAFVAGLLCAVTAGFIKDNSRIKEDTVLGIVFSGMFALGLVLYSQIDTAMHLNHILFGNILGTGLADIIGAGIIAVLVGLFVILFRADLLTIAFDPVHARALGLPVALLHYGLLALISITVVGALGAVGLIMAIALLVGPGATALLLTRRFSRMIWLAVVVGQVSGLVGVWASFWLDSAPAPTIVLVMTGLFIAAFVRQLWRGRRARTPQAGTSAPAA